MSKLPRNGLRKSAAKWAMAIVRKERRMRENGSLIRLMNQAEAKRRKLTKKKPESTT